MKKDTVLFEGTVDFAWEFDWTDPHSEVINLEYPLPPINTYKIEYNEEIGEVEEHFDGVSDFGRMEITLPVFHGLKPGDKIKVVKCN